MLAEISGDQLAIAHANLNLSNIYRRTRNWEKAHQAAQKAFELYQSLNLSTFLTKASITLILTWAETGEWDKIGQLSNDLILFLNASGDVHNLSQLKNNLGILAFGQELPNGGSRLARGVAIALSNSGANGTGRYLQ